MSRPRVLEWLKGQDQPAVEYRTLRELEGRPESDPQVASARKRIPTIGWAAEILAQRDPGGWWVQPESLYRPKYLSTHWQMLVLSDLGVTRALRPVRESCELWMRGFAMKGGGVGGNSKGDGHHCVVGNMTRALIRLGYGEDPRVRRSLEWLVRTADPKGGWSCFGEYGRGRNLDSWEGLSAFAAYPRSQWTASMQRCIESAAEYFLSKELHHQGTRYPPWYRLHYPVHYYYDLLVGLDLLTSLGYSDDPRLRYALAWLQEKRRRDGRWNLDAQHPDAGGSYLRWWTAHPGQRPKPLRLETVGRPSKMITLTAMKVLDRVDGVGP